MSATPFVTRFAPSPTGLLHPGHAFSALTAWSAARAARGRFLLRIEDIDTARCRPEYEAAALEDLAWLGLDWELPVRRQSEHMSDYRAALETLQARGLLYRCFKTRREVLADIGRAPHGAAKAYRGAPLPASQEAKRLADGDDYAWRLSLDAVLAERGDWSGLGFFEEDAGPNGESGLIAAQPDLLGDVILARKGLGVAYHLAVVVDDALQGVSHVIRGDDLFEAAHIQSLLQTLLCLPLPTYRHHRLLMAPSGKRLSKRDGAISLAELRRRGTTPAALRRELGFKAPRSGQ